MAVFCYYNSMIVGIDEVGRGCWAGPVVAGAVVLSRPIPGLTDSKLLSKKRREELAEIIKKEAVAWGLGWVDAVDIDISGINTAVKRAMELALAEINTIYDEIIIDGHINFLSEIPGSKPVIKADLTIPAVSAASILAKVARDQYMAEAALRYPNYAFEKHVGYGTAAHIAALNLHGVCELHRLSYKPIKTLMA